MSNNAKVTNIIVVPIKRPVGGASTAAGPALAIAGCTLAIVVSGPVRGVWPCPATFTDKHTCLANGRRCWDKNTPIVAYKVH